MNSIADLAKALRVLRVERGWSQEELAFRANTHQTLISKFELGKTESRISTLKKIARALGYHLMFYLESDESSDE